eukprot:TRINITY_DN2317_c0_g2_i3.p1 TRINITY_DN2317_c0_g2~~TRINITY_DN2317_c0_g2_i3.p1  ORF type:complete len:114 (-),score=20.98 TRINITY_DN2317_c0_g2_i3:70-411(-)
MFCFDECIITCMTECGIGLSGAARIGKMLEKNDCLVNLDLSYNNQIGEIGTTLIVLGLQMNTSLKKMEMFMCGIAKDDAARITRMFEETVPLLKVDFHFDTLFGNPEWDALSF